MPNVAEGGRPTRGDGGETRPQRLRHRRRAGRSASGRDARRRRPTGSGL